MTSMKYEDIKHRIVETSHNLNRIPVQAVKLLMAEEWAPLIAEGDDGSVLPDIESPHISIITHMRGREGGRYPYWVRTVSNSDNPAFFFIHSYGGEAMTQVYVLSTYWTQAVLRVVVDLTITATSVPYIAECVTESDEVWVSDRLALDIKNSTEPPKYEYW